MRLEKYIHYVRGFYMTPTSVFYAATHTIFYTLEFISMCFSFVAASWLVWFSWSYYQISHRCDASCMYNLYVSVWIIQMVMKVNEGNKTATILCIFWQSQSQITIVLTFWRPKKSEIKILTESINSGRVFRSNCGWLALTYKNKGGKNHQQMYTSKQVVIMYVVNLRQLFDTKHQTKKITLMYGNCKYL